MGQKAITIYTPSGTSAHISAEDDAFIHRSILGANNGFLSGILGSLACVKADNNTVRLSGGGVSNRGYVLWIPDGENIELSIDSGVAGYKRIDTVAAVFTRGGGETADTHSFTVIKGTAVTGTPSAPSLTTSSLTAAGNVNQVELFQIYINGTTLSSITQTALSLPRVPRFYYGPGEPNGSFGKDGDIYFKIVN